MPTATQVGAADDRRANVWTIVVAAGSGRRFGRPKQFEPLDARRVIDVSCDVAASCTDGVVAVVPPSAVEHEGGVAGGETRSASVRAGLEAVPSGADVICVHDAARPLASHRLYRRVIDAVLDGADAAIPAVAVTDTIKVIDGPVPTGNDTEPADAEPADDVLGVVVDTPDRSRLVAVQTPQAFRAERLRGAHESGVDATDDAALIEASGGRVVVVRGEATNIKITEPADLEWARRQLSERDPS